MTKSLSKKIKLYGVIAAALIVGVIIFMNRGGSSSDVVEEYHKVKRGSLLISVKEGGSLKAVEEVQVKNQLTGNSKIIFLVPDGSIVNKGDLLVELDATEINEQIKKLALEVENNKTALVIAKNKLFIDKSTVESDERSAQKDITFAKMDLEKFTKLDKQQKLRNTETSITEALDSYKLVEQRYDWSKKLADKGFETKSQVDRDRLDLNAKLKALETSRSKQKMLKEYDLPKQEAKLESKMSEAEEKFLRVNKQGESKISRAEAELASQSVKLTLNQERLTEITGQLKYTKLYASVSGLTLYHQPGRRSRSGLIEQGASISKNRTIMTIPNITQMKAVLSVPEFHINKVEVGQNASVILDSISNRRFNAKVSKVGLVPESTSWMNKGEKSYRVEVLITDDVSGVKPNVSVKVEVIIDELEDVISVPLQALTTSRGKYFCYVKNGNESVKTKVTIGSMNNSFVEIKEGLSDGDSVLLTHPAD